jgi:hypothetical protein
METLDKVYVASHDDGLHQEYYAYSDAENAWHWFMSYYQHMVGEGGGVDLGELRSKLVERGESVSLTYTDVNMEDHIISVCVEDVKC